MKPGLKWTLIVAGALVLAYAALVAFASPSDGHAVDVTLKLGTKKDGKMYLKCGPVAGATCSDGEQATLTVAPRDRVTLRIHNDDGGDHSHDFNVRGWQYAFPPVSPEMELHAADESWTFTAWSAGSFDMVCELAGHEAAGMRGILRVTS